MRYSSLLLPLIFLMACSSSKDSASPTPQNPPPAEKNYAPPGSLTIDGGDAQLTYALQEVKLNTLSELSPGRIGLFYKIFSLKTVRDLTIGLDHVVASAENCKKNVDPGIELTIDSEIENKKVVIDLNDKKIANIKAGIDYNIRLLYTNYGACEKVNYSFGLLAFDLNTQKLATAPPPPLPNRVICLTPNKISTEQKALLFDFKLGRADRPEIWLGTPGTIAMQMIYDAYVACGLDASALKCDPTMSFDGNVFSRSLSCTAEGNVISSGEVSFDLQTGVGHLSCKASSGKSFDLELSNCQGLH